VGSRKIRTGIGAADIVALVFVIVGGVFAAVSVGTALNLPAIQARGTGSAALLPVVFGAVGGPFLVIGIILAAVSARKRAMIRRVVEEGRFVMADVADIRPNYSVEINGRCPYVLECHYRDPASGTLHVFRSRNLFFCPAETENRQVRVYVDPENFSRYYVDVESLVPDVEIH